VSPCNAPAGLNETINLYDQLLVYRLLPTATGYYPFCLVRAPSELNVRPFVPNGCGLNWS